jgi:plastocyanin
MPRSRTTAAAAVLLLSVAALGAAAPAPNLVTIGNFTFTPQVLTVRQGATVTWVNGDDIPHTVVATDQTFRSKPLDSDGRFSFTFAKPGTYAYFCSIHPRMTGKIVVTGP